MSVIIRLQNLPWSANAADIRKYFHGLSIPEGGVHIVGGEQGDAFIAFSTDEDARQAMLIDGGKINEVKIKLLLSSRSEMQKVIETARQQAMNLQTYMQMPAQPPVMPSMASLQNIQLMHQMAQHVMPMGLHPVQVPQVPLPNQFNPLSAMKMPTNNIMTNNLTQNQMQNQLSPSSTPQPQEVVTDVDKIKSDSEDESKKGSHRSRESSHSRSRSRSKEKRDRKDYRHRDRRDRDKDHGRDRDRYRERDRDRDRDKERERDRERDRDRRRRSNSRDKHRSRRHRSRSRERSRRSESSRDTDRHHDRDRDKERDRRRSNSKEVNGDGKASDQETIKQPDTVLINGTPAVTSGDESPSAVARPMNPVLGFPRTSGMAQPPLPGSNQFPPMPEPPRMPSWPFPGHMMSSPILDDQKQVPWGAPQPGPGTLPPPPMFMPPDFLVNSGSFPPNMKEEKPRKHIEKQNEENHSSESNTPKNSCVQIQNLSARANYADIERFFHGLQIVESGIKMINNDDGNRSGIAYVRFANDNLKNQALKLSGRSLRETKVKVVHLDDYVYNEAIDNFQPARPKDNKPLFDTLKLLQLPRYIKEKDIMSLFTNVRPRKVIIYPNENLCDAFVEFENPQEAAQAISQPLMLGRHQIAVEPVFEKDPSLKLSSVGTNMFLMDQKPEPEIPGARTDPRRKSIPEKELANNSRPPHLSEPLLETPVISTDCLLLKGLPFKANDRDILDFFSDVGIVPSKIHIMFDKQRKPAGDAFCEFNSIDEANRGLVKQNAPLDRNLVSVVPVPRHEMLRALGIVAPIPPMAPMPGPGPIPGMMMPPMGIRMPPAMHPRPVRPDMFPGPPKFPPAPRMDPDFNHDSINVDGFGKPGCVITLENVPFSAGVEDILHFFKGFELMRQNIIRRFDDNGKPTGDARVCLKTPAEAQEAVQKLNKKTIRHRIIYLSALD